MTFPDPSRRDFLRLAGASALAAYVPADAGLLGSLRTALAAAFLQQADADDLWPFLIQYQGSTVTVYQPQPETLDGNRLIGRAALSLARDGAKEPTFGSMRFEATLSIDTERRTFHVDAVDITSVTLPPQATDDDRTLVLEMLRNGLSAPGAVFDLDPLLESLASAETSLRESQDLATAPPRIVTATEPAILVTIDGAPILAPVEEGAKVERVVNTPYTILHDPGGKFYLKGDPWWYVADAATGPWSVTQSVPKAIEDALPPLPREIVTEEKEARAASLEGAEGPTPPPTPPRVIVATEPTELIWSDGTIKWTPVPETALKYASNSTGYVFLAPDGKVYTVLSGRWYTGPSIEGPWSYVPSDKLPADFRKIPTESEAAGVLPFVAGTDEAKAAVAAQEIPTTAEIKRDATTRVNWAGTPQFNDITGTTMRASENAGTPVIKLGAQYFACQNGVWYVSDQPDGNYRVATSVPPEIYTIPPQHPFYFITFVRVFGADDEVVYTGYYPGYKGSYQLGGTVVNGTGYNYQSVTVNNVYILQPAPPTWGFGMMFNPWTGWSMGMSFGFGVGAGWFVFTIGRRPPFCPWWGPVGWSPWWRPPFHAGFRPPFGWHRPVFRPPYVPVYRPGGNWNRPGGGGGYYGGYRPSTGPRPTPLPGGGYNNIYSRPANMDRVRPSTRPGQLPAGGRPSVTLPDAGGRPGKPATRPAPQPGRPGAPATRPGTPTTRPPNNVYTDRSGNVYRQGGDGRWEQNVNGRWQAPTSRPTEGGAATRPAPAPGQQRPAPTPAPGQRPTTRPAPTPDLGASAAARDRAGNRNPGGPPYAGNPRPAPKPAPAYKPPPTQRPAPSQRPAPTSRPAPSSRPAPTSRPAPSSGGRRR